MPVLESEFVFFRCQLLYFIYLLLSRADLLGTYLNKCIACSSTHESLNRAINASLALAGLGASMVSPSEVSGDPNATQSSHEDLFSIRSPLRIVDFESGGIVSALKTSLQIAPNTTEDAVSFHMIVILLRRLASMDTDSVNEHCAANFYSSLMEFLFGPAHIDVLESIVFNTIDERFSYFASAAVCDSLALMEDLLCKFQPHATGNSDFKKPSYLAAEMLEGSALPVLLARIASSETFPVRLTALACRSLRTLCERFAPVVLPSLHYDASSCIYENDPHITADSLADTMSRIMSYFPVRNAAVPFHESLKVNSLYQNNPSYSAVSDVIAAARLLRAPDSMLGTSSTIGSLKLLRFLIKAAKNAAVDRTTPLELRTSPFTWPSMSWLLRYLHDRRGILRLLAVDMISSIIDVSSMQDLIDVGDDHACSINAPDFALLPAPISNLKHILLDETEAPLIKISCLKVMVNVFLTFCASKLLTCRSPGAFLEMVDGKSSQAVIYRSLIGSIIQCVDGFIDRPGSPDHPHVSSDDNRQVLAVFERILNDEEYFKCKITPLTPAECNVLAAIQEDVVHRCRPFKLFAKIVNTIDSPSKDTHRSLAVARALGGFYGAFRPLGRDGESSPAQWAADSHPFDIIIFKWCSAQGTHAAIASLKAMVLCHRLSEVCANSGLFSQCIRNTNLAKNVISCLISCQRDGGRFRSTCSLACSNLLGAMLLDEKTCRPEAQGKSHGISDLLKDNSAVQLSIVRSLIVCIQYCCKRLSTFEPNTSEASDSLVHLNSFVRVLSLVVDSHAWRRNLGLGVPFFCPQQGVVLEWSAASLLLDGLLAAYETVTKCHEKSPKRSANFILCENRILFFLGELFRHSSAVRTLESDRFLNNGSSLVAGVLDKLASLLHGMESQVPVLSIKDPAVSRSLKLLKSKFSSPPKRASVDASRSQLTMSPDSVAEVQSPTTSTRSHHSISLSSKTWRDKTRSFSISTSKPASGGRSRANQSLRDTNQVAVSNWYLSPIDRSSAWACLLLLQGILLDSATMQSYCRQRGLEDLLGKCLCAFSTWSATEAVDRGCVNDMLCNRNIWCPSHGQVATAALSCLSSLLYHEKLGDEEGETLPSRDATVSSLLMHALASPSGSLSRSRASQWLSMSLVSSILRPVTWLQGNIIAPKRAQALGTVSIARRKLFMRSVYGAVQSYLESRLHPSQTQQATHGDSAADMFSGLNVQVTLSEPIILAQILDVLSSLATSAFPKTASEDCFGQAQQQPVPWPDLVSWLRDVQGTRGSTVSVALSRLIGRIDSIAGASASQTKKLSPLSSSHAALDTLIGYLLDFDSKSIIDVWSGEPSDQGSTRDLTVAASAVALWSIAHRSEQAKAVLRQRRPELLDALQRFDEQRPSVAAALRTSPSLPGEKSLVALVAISAVKRILAQS